MNKFLEKYFSFDSPLATRLNREQSMSDAVLVIFAFLLLLLVFSLNYM